MRVLMLAVLVLGLLVVGSQALRDLELVVSRLAIEVRGEPGARLSIDGDEIGVTPLPDAVAVDRACIRSRPIAATS